MSAILWLVGALVVLWLAGPIIRFVLAVTMGKTIGKLALAQQPDAIHLSEADDGVWSDAEKVGGLAHGLTTLGFENGGTWKVSEMPGLTVRLMAHPVEHAFAVVYEHPQAGVWFDVGWRYEDGTSGTWTTCRPTGLDPRPGHSIAHAQGSTPAALFERAKKERSPQAIRPLWIPELRQVFEEAYADSTAWRKKQGLSRTEVVRAGMQKAA